MEKTKPKYFRIILVALLVGITIFSVFKYVYTLREKYELLSAINQIKAQLAALEIEKQGLVQDLDKEKQLSQQVAQENSGLKDSLKEKEDKMNYD